MNEITKNTLILTAITLISGLALGGVHHMTKEPIEQRSRQEQAETYARVLPQAVEFSDAEAPDMSFPEAQLLAVSHGMDSSGQSVGDVFLVLEKEGYGGDIELAVGIDTEGIVTGVDILSISETPGLGMRAKEDEFLSRFKDKSPDMFTYVKGGGSDADAVTSATADVSGSSEAIDAISGATITTNAMVNGVNLALEAYRVINETESAPAQ